MKKAKTKRGAQMRREYKRSDFPDGLIRGKYAARMRAKQATTDERLEAMLAADAQSRELSAHVGHRPRKPLALYVFSDDKTVQHQVLDRTSSGGACVNDTVAHLGAPDLPFGGVGPSGMGAYHGRHGFETFSHRKGVLHKSTLIDPALRYPPYDAGKVKWIGRGMTRGRIRILGDAGMHLGAHMTGGTIEVSGNASDWLGAEMAGGLIRVRGNAGGQVGAAYRGSVTGMTNGTILIGGSAGLEVGMRMRRGLIVVGGLVRDFAGLEMKGGTIVLRSGAELRTGAWMTRGTIVSLAPLPLLPTFTYSSTYSPTFLRVWGRHLSALGVGIPYEEREGAYQRYTGDASVPGKGEILVWKPHAS